MTTGADVYSGGASEAIIGRWLAAHPTEMPWSPLGGGWLSGKYRRDVPPVGSTRLGENPERGMEAWEKRNSSERTWKIIGAVTAIADAHGVSPSRVALAWLGAQPAVTSVILGARLVEQLSDNMAALTLQLSAAKLDLLTKISAPQADDYPYGEPGVTQRRRNLRGGR